MSGARAEMSVLVHVATQKTMQDIHAHRWDFRAKKQQQQNTKWRWRALIEIKLLSVTTLPVVDYHIRFGLHVPSDAPRLEYCCTPPLLAKCL